MGTVAWKGGWTGQQILQRHLQGRLRAAKGISSLHSHFHPSTCASGGCRISCGPTSQIRLLLLRRRSFQRSKQSFHCTVSSFALLHLSCIPACTAIPSYRFCFWWVPHHLQPYRPHQTSAAVKGDPLPSSKFELFLTLQSPSMRIWIPTIQCMPTVWYIHNYI